MNSAGCRAQCVPAVAPPSIFHGEFFWSGDLVRSLEAVRQSAHDVRTLMAWLRSQGYDEVGVTGLSLGGSITMLLACVDPTPDYIMPIIAHLQLSEAVEEASILWRMRSDLESFGVDRARRRELFGRIGLDKLAPKLARERQLWVAAKNDQYITAPLVERQWKEWGKPPIEWIAGGHMTFPLQVPRLLGRIKEFHSGLR